MISDLCHYNDTRAWKTIPIFLGDKYHFSVKAWFEQGSELDWFRDWAQCCYMWVELSCYWYRGFVAMFSPQNLGAWRPLARSIHESVLPGKSEIPPSKVSRYTVYSYHAAA